MRRIIGILVAVASAFLIATPAAQAAPQPAQQPSSQIEAVAVQSGPVIQGWAYICTRYRDVGVRHYPGGPAFAQIFGGSDIYVDDYRDRVWVHISWPVSGYILYSTVCQ